MVPLRVVAICSNVLFASFGALAHIYPVLVLHVILLPVNVARLMQIFRLIKGVRAIQLSEISIDSMLPFMSHRFVKAGQVLMNKGDKADRIYYLVSRLNKFLHIRHGRPRRFRRRAVLLTKVQAYCDMGGVLAQIDQAEQKKDTKAAKALGAKADSLAQQLGPDYTRVMNGLQELDPNSAEGRRFTAVFEPLFKQCK